MRVLRILRGTAGASPLGPLETQIMEIVWESGQPVSVRDVLDALIRKRRNLAYSTVKAVLTNLTNKRYLRRREDGRVNYFSPTESRQEFRRKTVNAVIDSLLKQHRDPLLANLVDRLAVDVETLDDLERLIAKKRAELGKNE
jgi:predicted transcriptional regulator